jgi:hypothetical protein
MSEVVTAIIMMDIASQVIVPCNLVGIYTLSLLLLCVTGIAKKIGDHFHHMMALNIIPYSVKQVT